MEEVKQGVLPNGGMIAVKRLAANSAVPQYSRTGLLLPRGEEESGYA